MILGITGKWMKLVLKNNPKAEAVVLHVLVTWWVWLDVRVHFWSPTCISIWHLPISTVVFYMYYSPAQDMSSLWLELGKAEQQLVWVFGNIGKQLLGDLSF